MSGVPEQVEPGAEVGGAAAFLKKAWSLDLRSLALFRVCLAGLIIFDLIARSTELRTYYTDLGILPRAEWHALRPAGYWSLHAVFGSTTAQAFLFLLAALIAIMMFAGWHTRSATAASWVLLISLQNRMPLIETQGDALLRLLLFWAMFLPLGARWSIDGARRGFVHQEGSDQDEYATFTPASIALMIQVALVFLCGYLLKTSPEWKSGRAMFFAVNMEQMATNAGRGMLHFPRVLTFLSRLALWADLLVPALIFFPWKHERVRTSTVTLVIFLQVALGMVLRLGLTPFVIITAMLALLPAWYWESQERSAHLSDHIDWLLTERLAQRESRFQLPRVTHRIASGIAIVALAVVVLWNITTLRSPATPVLARLAQTFRLDQRWDLLAPRPYQDDGWYLIPALRHGEEVDLFRDGAPVKWNKPPETEVFRQATSYHSQVFLAKLRDDAGRAYRPMYARYLCRNWNRWHSDQSVQSVEVDFMRRMNLFDHGTFSLARRYVLAKESCR